MSDAMCRGCGGHLVFSARARGNGLCGPCTRAEITMAEAILGAIWVAAVQAQRRGCFRKQLRARGLLMAIAKVSVFKGQLVNTSMVTEAILPVEVNGYDLHQLEVALGYPPRGLVPPDLG